MPRLYNLARVLSTTAGTGTVTLGPAVQGFLTFAQAGVPNGQEVSYGIRDGANSEVGTGVYSSTGPTLTRAVVTNSTNLGAYINLSGSEEVYITARAEDIGVPDMSYSGMQINGGMEVSQENGANNVTGITNAAKYTVDGWLISSVGTQVMAAVQHTSAFPPGFTASLQTWVTTANAAPAAGHYATFTQFIEGTRMLHLAWGTASASPITISFWVFAARIGNYSGSITNAASFNRSYVFTFTVNAATTWEYKTVTIPGDTTGTWSRNETRGMTITIALMVGTTYQTTAGAWTAGGFLGATGTINGVAVTSDTMLITGVTVLPGTQAPTAAQSPNIMRPYDQELVTCQRYWQQLSNIVWSGYNTVGQTYFYTYTPWPVAMRAGPTLSIGSPSYGNASEAGIQGGSLTGTTLQAKVLGAGSAVAIVGSLTGDARL